MHSSVASGFRSLKDIDPTGKTLLVRLDLNVPMQLGKITDTTRVVRSMPTIHYLRERGAKVVILSHFDRPKGKFVPSMSLAPLVDALEEALGCAVKFGVDCIGKAAEEAVASLQPGDVLLLENLRFHAEEEANEPAFAKALARLGDVFVNDAFSCSHRAHASIVGVAEHLPAVAGLLMQAELEALSAALTQAERPLMAIVGGAKVSTKLQILSRLVEKVDKLVIGGGMANTFLFAQGYPMGKSLHEENCVEEALAVLQKAKQVGCEVLLPVDVTVSKAFAPRSPNRVTVPADVQPDELILDVGAESYLQLAKALCDSKTLLWNGPVGAFETPPFDVGSLSIARLVAARTRQGRLTSVAGGGDTLAALAAAGLTESLSYISTAGGAFLEWLEGKDLPGVAALQRATRQAA